MEGNFARANAFALKIAIPVNVALTCQIPLHAADSLAREAVRGQRLDPALAASRRPAAGEFMRLTPFILPVLAAIAFVPSAAALDCAKIENSSETAICADPALKAAEDAMTAAYDGVMSKLVPDQQAALRTSQERWLADREWKCYVEDIPEVCILTKTETRTAFLTGKPVSGPGLPAPVLPYFVAKAQTEKVCSVLVALQTFGAAATTEGEKAFDAAILAQVEAPVGEFGARESTPGFPNDCFYAMTSTITYGSPDLIAASPFIDVFRGGPVGYYDTIPVVTDLKTGKAPVLADHFDALAVAKLVETCTASLTVEKIKRFGVESEFDIEGSLREYAGTIAAHVGDFGYWLIYDDRAEVWFGPYDLGSYAEGDYVCTLPKAELQAAAGAKGWIVP